MLAVLALVAPAAGAEPPPGGVAGVPVPHVAWADCGDGFRCATASVPRDYRDPAAGTFDLALIRLPARDQANRIGTLFLNPGGPGGSGIDLVRDRASAFAPLNARFDLVGFDPRGVGASRPAVDCLSDPENELFSRQPFLRPGLSVRGLRAGARFHGERCLERNRSTASSPGAPPSRRAAGSAAATRRRRSTPCWAGSTPRRCAGPTTSS